MPTGLFQKSIEILKVNQSPSGAFTASPNFPPYQYSWLRDGTFIAYALDLAGEGPAARQFYDWAFLTVQKHHKKIGSVLEKKRKALSIADDEYLHTRYNLSGEEGQEPWGNFQLDGYGTLLWGVAHHMDLHGVTHLPAEWQEAVPMVVQYLLELWSTPCLDCWEEGGNNLHPSTLAAIYGGLDAIRAHVVVEEEAISEIRERVIRNYSTEGYFVKLRGAPVVDANLLWIAVPFNLVPPSHPVMSRTVEEIEKQLVAGGVHRYRGDSYYGGGQWIILAAWLAWYYIQVGDLSRAKELICWIEQQADEHGEMPEQVPTCLLDQEAYHCWLKRGGPIAKPLLWSHAMYVIVTSAYDRKLGEGII